MFRWNLFVVFILLHLSAIGQDNSTIFFHLTESNGLSYNVVNSIFKDSRGLLWIGTYNGFNRFDGRNFFKYKIRKGSNSMQSEVVHSLCEDKNGFIWGATDKGVFRYDLLKDSFTNYMIKSMNKSTSFFEILCDEKGDIYTLGIWSVFRFNATKQKFEEVFVNITNTDSLNYFRNVKNGIVESPNKKGFWICTTSGILYYDKITKKRTDWRNTSKDSLFAPRSSSAIYKSKKNKIWFFDNDQSEIICFNPESLKIENRIKTLKNRIKSNVTTLFIDHEQQIWLNTWSYEMFKISISDGKTQGIEHNDNDLQSIPSSFVWDYYEDNNNTLWLATLSGIAICNNEYSLYNRFYLPNFIPELKTNSITNVFENTQDKTIWFTNAVNQLFHYWPKERKYKIYHFSEAKSNSNGMKPNGINHIQFYKNRIIISTYTGSWQITNEKEILEPLDLLPFDYKNFKCCEAFFLGDTLAVYNSGESLLIWDRIRQKTEFISHPKEDGFPEGKTIISGTLPVNFNSIYVAFAGDYLGHLDKNRNFSKVKLGTAYKDNNGSIKALEEDKNGNIWILYRSAGLFLYHTSSNSLQLWDEPDGLPGNRIHCMTLDEQERMWLMVYNKISVFLPATNKFFNFKIPYSESNYFYINTICKSSGNKIIASINNDLFEFYPDKLLLKPKYAHAKISQILATDTIIPIFNNEKIKLKSYQNTLHFFFGNNLIEEVFPHEVEYILEGAEKNWTISKNRFEAVYNNLNPGDYIFKVRLRGKNNNWISDESIIKFTIQTPFLKSIWFILLCIFLFASLVYFIYRFRLSKQKEILTLESKAEQLEKEKTMVLYDSLKQQLNPHFLFNSLTSLSSLIEINPSLASEFLDNLSKTYRYILKSRDNETVPLSNELQFTELYIKLQKTRFENGFIVETLIPEDYYHRRIAPVTLQNLIENAIKHNILDEESPLKISITIEDDYIVIRNNIQRKKMVETSNKQGLVNLQSLYTFLSEKPIKILEEKNNFIIYIPLI